MKAILPKIWFFFWYSDDMITYKNLNVFIRCYRKAHLFDDEVRHVSEWMNIIQHKQWVLHMDVSQKFCHGLYIMQILYILVLSKKLFDKLIKIVMYAWCIEMGWVLLYYFFAYLHKSGPAWAWNVSCILSTTLQLQFESW